MFKFLKEKLKSAISKISEGVEKEGEIGEKIIEKSAEEPKREEKGFFAKLKKKFTGKEETIKEEAAAEKEIFEPEAKAKPKLIGHKERELQKPKEKIRYQKEEPAKKRIEELKAVPEVKFGEKKHAQRESADMQAKPILKEQRQEIKEKAKEEIKPKIIEEEPAKKGFFESIKEKITTTKIGEVQFEKLFWDMEIALMENNVAVEVVGKIKNDLKEQLVEKPIRRTKVEETILLSLKNSIEGLFQNSNIELIQQIKNKKDKPYIIAFFGINGSGKTTSIAKLANMLKEKNISCILAASDTFRAASIEQLQMHADQIGIKLIKHDYGSDPAAVAFDAIKHAKAKNIDAVLIDTAGRMHSNQNLIDEMKKIIRVAKPDLKIFVGESITGNDCIEQAKAFNESIGIDGIILAKADIDEKGGAAVSVSYVTKKPILYLGTGQSYRDLEEFNKEKIIKNIGLA